MKNSGRIVALIVLILFSITTPLAAKPGKTIKLTTCNRQPYGGVNLTNLGVASDLITQLFKRLGYQAHIDILPWQQALDKTARGECHMVYNAHFSEERTKTFAFSDSYLDTSLHLCSRWEDGISYGSLEELAKYKIGVVEGVVYSKAFEAAGFLNKVPAPTDQHSLKALMDGKVDLIAIDKIVGTHLVKTSPFLTMPLDHLTFHEPPLEKSMPLYAMFSKVRPGYHLLIKAFNRELAAMAKDGTLDTLLKIHGFK